ncbi:MAG TPA: FlgO family outer membrane protein [Candidatus Aquilonibacter sp.]|nr:FlgO family outer membrane protein [Candidatus Aquilonibacter sp.]
MKSYLITFLCFALCGHALAQDMDTELSNLATNLAAQIKDEGKKKVTVLDFTDLQGGSSELGKYIAEQLTVDLVMDKNGDFSVLDRANLKSILAEHKLTATGLIDPDTAKKLGQFSGVDAIILGTITPKDKNIALTAKIITTDTAEIIGAAKAAFQTNDTVQQLQSTAATDNNVLSDTSASVDLSDDKPKVVKTFGDLVVELQSLKIVNGGRQYELTMTLTNRSATKSLWVALGTTHLGNSMTSLTDPNGNQFGQTSATGISYARVHVQYGYGGGMQEFFDPATEIQPNDSDTMTLAFSSPEGRSASPGVCTLQIGFFLGDDFISNSAKHTTSPNLVTKFEAK